jgi:hypothetical protein
MSTRPWVEGDVTLRIDPAGERLFGYGGTVTMAHYNGPAMFAYSGEIVNFLSYADNRCHSKGYAAIIGDFYGKGRSVLAGPHPELDPTHPDILANLVVWAANKYNEQPAMVAKVSLADIGSGAATVKDYYDAYHTVPGTVTVGKYQLAMPQYLYLLGRGILNISRYTTSNIALRSIGNAKKTSGTNKMGYISKAAYLKYAKSLILFINSNGRVPHYQDTALGKIPIKQLIYMYSKIMKYYYLNGKLPSSITL